MIIPRLDAFGNAVTGVAHRLMRAASCRVEIPGVAYVTSGHMEHTRGRVWMFQSGEGLLAIWNTPIVGSGCFRVGKGVSLAAPPYILLSNIHLFNLLV